jgi:roundabout, axon guidance receptor 2
VKIGVNGMAKFECVASGNPQPSVYWTKEGMKELMFPDNTYDRHHVTLEGVLEIKNIQKDDAGYYVCSAFSVAGSATTRAFLEVSSEINFKFMLIFSHSRTIKSELSCVLHARLTLA